MSTIQVNKELTPTQEEIALVQMYCRGFRPPEIATKMGKNTRTLEGQTSRIRAKYGFKTNAQMCVEFYKAGILDSNTPVNK